MSSFVKIYKNISNILFYILLILFIIYALNILIFKYVYKEEFPRFFNYYIFNVASGSMEEDLHKGDYIIVKKTDNFDVGDVVTFQKENYFITHRVVKIEEDVITTKGDANSTEDDEIKRDDVIGKLVCRSVILAFLIENKFLLIAIILIFYLGGYLVELLNKKKLKEE